MADPTSINNSVDSASGVDFPPPFSPSVRVGDDGLDDSENPESTSLSYKRAPVHEPPHGVHNNELEEKFESLDYDPMENFVYSNSLAAKTMRGFARENVLRWFVVIVIGIVTALFALAIDLGVNGIAEKKFELTKNIISKCGDCFLLPFITYVCSNFLLVAVASFLVAFIEPLAAGSGIPEIKCYLNGVRVPRVVRLRTLIAKATGVMFSVAGGLPCGKEGPMIHTGAIVAAGVSQGQAESVAACRARAFGRKPSGWFSSFRNDNDKRDFVSSGAAAGVAAAFGAPVGGVLFSLEEGSSFWNQALTWRTFACSMICSFTLNVLVSGLVLGKWGNLSQPGLATFGSFTAQGNPGYTILQIPFFLILGVMGGLCGALFNYCNVLLTQFRKRNIHSPYARMLEALVISGLVSCTSFALSYYARDCVKVEPRCAPVLAAQAAPMYDLNSMLGANMTAASNLYALPQTPAAFAPPMDNRTCIETIEPNEFDYFCPKGHYNAMARIFFTTQEKAIRNLFHSEGTFSFATLSIFFVVYLSLACLTYGIAVPSGLFVPSILAGCALGRLVGHALQAVLPPSVAIDAGVFALVGGAAVLGGIVRMTISLTVIIIESTNDVTYGLPIMMTLMVAKWVGDFFNEGIYDWHIELAGVPFLEWEPPIVMRKFKALHVMSKPVVCFRSMERVSRIVDVLRTTSHNGFPVVDDETRFQGIILRSQLITLVRNRCFKRERGIVLARKELFDRDYPRGPTINQLEIDPADLDEWIDLAPYHNLPYTIRDRSPLSRVFRLFRTMGLRHLVVVDIGQRVVGIITRKDLTHLQARLIEQRRRQRTMRRQMSSGGSGSSVGNALAHFFRNSSGGRRRSDEQVGLLRSEDASRSRSVSDTSLNVDMGNGSDDVRAV